MPARSGRESKTKSKRWQQQAAAGDAEAPSRSKAKKGGKHSKRCDSSDDESCGAAQEASTYLRSSPHTLAVLCCDPLFVSVFLCLHDRDRASVLQKRGTREFWLRPGGEKVSADRASVLVPACSCLRTRVCSFLRARPDRASSQRNTGPIDAQSISDHLFVTWDELLASNEGTICDAL